MLEILLSILVLLMAIPSGYLLAWLCQDELKNGRKWFKLIAIISPVLGLGLIFFNKTVSLSLFFLAIISLVSLWKSY